MERVYIDESIWKQFEETALKTPDFERCGITKGISKGFAVTADEFVEIENISKKMKEVDYVMEPQSLMNAIKNTSFINKNSDVEWTGIWHTHPSGRPFPSMIDLKRAEYNVVYFITSINYEFLGGCFKTYTKAYKYNKRQNNFEEVDIIFKI